MINYIVKKVDCCLNCEYYVSCFCNYEDRRPIKEDYPSEKAFLFALSIWESRNQVEELGCCDDYERKVNETSRKN